MKDQTLFESLSLPSSISQVLALVVTCFLLCSAFCSKEPLSHIPTVGPSGLFGLWYGTIKSIFKARSILEKGHQKYQGRAFRMAYLGRWRVIISDPASIEEIRKVPDDTMSFAKSINDTLAAEYTMGPLIANNSFIRDLTRRHIARDYGTLVSDMFDELIPAIDNELAKNGSAWTSVPAFHTFTRIVVRITNRVIVGSSLCRNDDFLDLAHHYTEDVMIAANFINLFPEFLKSFVGKFLTTMPARMLRGTKLLEPTIKFRLHQCRTYGVSWPDKPNDMLSWFIDEAKGEARSVRALTQYVLFMNFAATHTTSITLTHALYQLVACPEYIAPLREEISRAIDEKGHTKLAFSQMRLLEAFIKESMRLHGVGFASVQRKVLQDYTFSDGTFLPAGTHFSCNASSIQRDNCFYDNASAFNPYRFFKSSNEGDIKFNSTDTSSKYLIWGYGKQSCPGRFFAALQIKAIIAHLILNYDFGLEGGGTYFPESRELIFALIPNPTAKMAFKKKSGRERE